MKQHLVVFAVAALAIASCSTSSTAPPGAGAYDKVEVVEEGGIAALSADRVVNHNDRSFVYLQRPICSTPCSASLESASGTLSAEATDS
ncbi:MAG: hypothetical protein JWM41_4700 [Gemmatimonadetes bacterium]|nr:hypothetical protein [Gemmatimonadota bacterium]